MWLCLRDAEGNIHAKRLSSSSLSLVFFSLSFPLFFEILWLFSLSLSLYVYFFKIYSPLRLFFIFVSQHAIPISFIFLVFPPFSDTDRDIFHGRGAKMARPYSSLSTQRLISSAAARPTRLHWGERARGRARKKSKPKDERRRKERGEQNIIYW